jgi:hypothetical protein
VKFKIVVLHDHGAIVYHLSLDAISPQHAKTKAENLLNEWPRTGTAGMRILDSQGREIHSRK